MDVPQLTGKIGPAVASFRPWEIRTHVAARRKSPSRRN
jgi:hypothetical protein